MMAIDEMAKLKTGDQRRDTILMLGVLCHDFGKPATTEFIEGAIRSRGHEKAGVEPTISFIKRLTDETELIERVAPLVAHHLKPHQLYSDNSSLSAIRRLSTKVKISDLVIVAKADFLGRDTPEAKSGEFIAGEWLLKRARELEVLDSAPKPLIGGKDLISLGMKPSKEFGEILKEIYKMQIEGDVKSKDEALREVEKLVRKEKER
jgi:tRNA nucleotidyltransferase (CCA-adding enzyme)